MREGVLIGACNLMSRPIRVFRYRVIRASDNTTATVRVTEAGGVANSATQDAFCTGTDCVRAAATGLPCRYRVITAVLSMRWTCLSVG